MTASIDSPGADVGAFQFCMYDGGEAGSFSNSTSDGPSSPKTVKLLAQWRVSLGTFAEEKKKASFEKT